MIREEWEEPQTPNTGEQDLLAMRAISAGQAELVPTPDLLRLTRKAYIAALKAAHVEGINQAVAQLEARKAAREGRSVGPHVPFVSFQLCAGRNDRRPRR